MSNRRHAASPPNAPPLWRANCCYGRNAFSHIEITLWTSSLIFLARRPTPRSAEGPRAFADDCDEVRIGEQSPCAVQAMGKHRLPRRQLSPSSWRCRMAMLARVRALGVKGGPYYCAQGTAIDGLLARRRYKPLTLADPPFDPHLPSDATR